jgi:ubiquinone biosynthesis monooxygenase Coq7
MSIPAHLPDHSAAAGRHFSSLDRLLAATDQAVRTLSGAMSSSRPYPAVDVEETVIEPAGRSRVGALMRINHAGEVAAQALYQGQALVARSEPLREKLLAAGREEIDHLDWCSQRIGELGARRSLLNPLWYAGSFAIGVLAGLSGDRYSLGFVAETERQVVDHLQSHLRRLPQEDARTRAIIEQMRDDEEHHGNSAISAGGRVLPRLARAFMKATAAIMTRTAYWI